MDQSVLEQGIHCLRGYVCVMYYCHIVYNVITKCIIPTVPASLPIHSLFTFILLYLLSKSICLSLHVT